jgi:hypothetical protein
VLVDRIDEIDLEEARNVVDIDPNAYLPPAVLAVYGVNGMPPALAPEDDEEVALSDAPFFDAQGATPGNLPETSSSTLPGISNARASLVFEPSHPHLYDDDDVPPEPDDWHLYEPPADDGVSWSGDIQSPRRAAAAKDAVTTSQDAYTAVAATSKAAPPTGPAAEQSGSSQASVSQGSPKPARTSPAGSQTTAYTSSVAMPFFVPPATLAGSQSALSASDMDEEEAPRMVTVILRSTGDKDRDVRRLKRIHGELKRFPGKDQFSFLVFESGRRFLMDFPNDTTGICAELMRKLIELAGEGNVHVEPIKLQ